MKNQVASPIISNSHLLKKNDKPLLSKPISIKFNGVITLSLNEEHCLTQLEVKANVYDTKIMLPGGGDHANLSSLLVKKWKMGVYAN